MNRRKSFLLLTISLLLVVLLTGCKSAAAKAADKAIEAIGTVSLESIDKIKEAEALVGGLKSKEYESLVNAEVLTNARNTYDTLYLESLIENIGAVTISSKNNLASIREQYDKANDVVKSAVSNYSSLTEAEALFEKTFVLPIENIINNIGKVTLSSKSKERIESARQAYDKVDADVQAMVSNADILFNAENEYEHLVIASIEDAINDIGTVSLNSGAKITNAREKYDQAEPAAREKVSNLDILTSAEAEFEHLTVDSIIAAIDEIGTVTLDSKSKIESVRKKYNNAGKSVQDRITNINTLVAAEAELDRLKTEAEIQSVINKIDGIGKVTLESMSKIEEAESAYNKLATKAKKEKVTNYDVLVAAREKYNDLFKKEYENAKSRMRITVDDIRGVTFYEPNRMPKYMNSRCSFLPYIGMRSNNSNNNWMLLKINYAGDDWVFFKKITIAVDDERYYKTFSYYDINRDNAGGMVGEIVDAEVSSADIEMLRKIVTSKKTVIRYDGDDYYHDYTLTDSDKSAIKDVLTIYDYLNKN